MENATSKSTSGSSSLQQERQFILEEKQQSQRNDRARKRANRSLLQRSHADFEQYDQLSKQNGEQESDEFDEALGPKSCI